jgi:hypothetical protein
MSSLDCPTCGFPMFPHFDSDGHMSSAECHECGHDEFYERGECSYCHVFGRIQRDASGVRYCADCGENID